MMAPVTIAHISDLHLSWEHKRFNLRRARRLLDAIARHEVDHLVVTGDVAADADRRDFDIARRLFTAAGLSDARKLSMVIGNHDIFGGVHVPEDILSFPRRCRQTDFGRKVEEFREQFHEAFERCLFASHGKTFPYAKIIGNVALIGLNSVGHYSPVRNPVGSNGQIGDGQFARLRHLLEAPPVRDRKKIVLVHHHFHKVPPPPLGALSSVWGAFERQTMKLRGKKRLFELFREQKVALVLHGHVHLNAAYQRKGMQFINGGGSLIGTGSGDVAFNLIRVAENSIDSRLITVTEEEPLVTAVSVPPELQAA